LAQAAKLQASNYSKIEKGEREPSIEALDRIAKLFGMPVDELIHFIEDKTIHSGTCA
jgi:transcriptional regulator with XRE-family HTH domain